MLEKFLRELEKVLPDFEKEGMNPGASDTALKATEEVLKPFGFTSELLDLYCWHNGSSTGFLPEIPLFGFQFLSLQESVETIKMLGQGQYGENWATYFLPVGDIDGALMLATLNNLDNDRSLIFQYVIEEGDAYLMHQSIQSLIQTAVFVWSVKALEGQLFDDVRLRFSPHAYKGTQEGSTNTAGVQNVFDFASALPCHSTLMNLIQVES